MTIKLFDDEAGEPVESQQTQASIGARLLYCALAYLVAVIPALAAAYSAYSFRILLSSMKNEESSRTARVLAQLHILNGPLVIALGVAALVAFGIALVLGVERQRRLVSVGLPFSIGILAIAATPGLLLWQGESIALDVLAGKYRTNASIAHAAETTGILLFCATALGVLAVAATFLCSVVSLCLSPRSRSDVLSLRRAVVWAITGTLLLVFAISFFFVA